MSDHEGTLQFEHDNLSMKTKIISTRLGGFFGMLILDEKSFFHYLVRL